jgi:alpha-beta hydrolase superfamily lysophospholipase
MKADTFFFEASDGARIFCHRWYPDAAPRAAIHIAHGMGEHSARYARVAEPLVAAGYAVLADDHRGHGQTAVAAGPDCLGDFGAAGWDRVVEDACELNGYLATEFPGVPRVLFGHSMGSMLAQQYLYRHGDTLTAAVLSGSPGFGSAFQLFLSHTIARFERWRLGPAGESALMDKLLFGNANETFDGPEATGFEWLSRDESEVQLYVDDPFCGFVVRTGGLCTLFCGGREARKKSACAMIPPALPIYVFSGADDPVHGEFKNINRLLTRYAEAGVSTVQHRFYEGGRHEMLNETNRDEVTDDLLAWLFKVS